MIKITNTLVKLTQGMFADVSCNAFNLSYGNRRSDALITNAGWFNSRGERLGFGDLSLKDFDTIFLNMTDDEVFIAISEADSTWDFPSDLDRNCPGIQYVMNRARWAVSTIYDSAACVFQVIDSPLQHKETIIKPCGTYYKYDRLGFFKSVKFDGHKFTALKSAVVVDKIYTSNYYGLDEYHMSDNTIWACGNYNQAVLAATTKARNTLHMQDSSLFRDLTVASNIEIDAMDLLVSHYGVAANQIIVKILGNDNTNYVIENIIASKGLGILSIDGVMHREVEGLPHGQYYFRVA